MNYDLMISKKAQKEFSLIPAKEYERIKTAIYGLSVTPLPSNCLKLRGREGWRLRIGKYRVIYDIDEKEKIITVLHIGHRRYIYDKG